MACPWTTRPAPSAGRRWRASHCRPAAEALAEAERAFPDLLTRIERILAELGLSDEEIAIRMTGCPNNCARPLLAEIGIIGKVPDKYNLYLGGNQASTRLNRLFKENVKTADLADELRPLFVRFAAERQPHEPFGDFCQRLILNGQHAGN